HGLGVSWNPDGVPVYGLTSQLWVFCVVPLTWIALPGGPLLQLGSWLTGMIAIVVMSVAVRRQAGSEQLRKPAVACCAVALPLLLVPFFSVQLTTGMDTMLSLLANAALTLGVMKYIKHPTRHGALMTGGLGFVAVLARPDNILCALGVPFLAWL